MTKFSDSLDMFLYTALTHPDHKDKPLGEILQSVFELGVIPEAQVKLSLARLVRNGGLTARPQAEPNLPEDYRKYRVTFYFAEREEALDFLQEHGPKSASGFTHNIITPNH